MKLTNSANFYDDSAFRLYLAIVQFFLYRYITDDDIPIADGKLCNLRQVSLISPEFAQELWTRPLSCVSV